MKISYCPYTLNPRRPLNSVSAKKERSGVLLKVEWSGRGIVGYSDLHPWVELGDQDLTQQLEGLKSGTLSELSRQSLKLAWRDAELRQSRRNIFANGSAIKNNYILPDGSFDDQALLKSLRQDGFDTVKLKMGRDLPSELASLASVVAAGFRVRLDFNASIDFKTYLGFIKNLSSSVRDAIEYVEDPFPFDFQLWNEARQYAPLALDNFGTQVPWAAWNQFSSLPFDVLILKPAKTDFETVVHLAYKHNLKLTVTNYMDHPVGSMHALGIAMKLKQEHGDKVLQAGCFTHHLYEQNLFSQHLTTSGAFIQPVAGMGVGFDSLLETLPWQILNTDFN